uniref:Uncharacterized protein n=1 Tax=Arundo donax TaxID=35708 RepID=A0A0A8ZP92_ARUDO
MSPCLPSSQISEKMASLFMNLKYFLHLKIYRILALEIYSKI